MINYDRFKVKPVIELSEPVLFLTIDNLVAKRLAFYLVNNTSENIEEHRRRSLMFSDYETVRRLPENLIVNIHSDFANTCALFLEFGHNQRNLTKYRTVNFNMIQFFLNTFLNK